MGYNDALGPEPSPESAAGGELYDGSEAQSELRPQGQAGGLFRSPGLLLSLKCPIKRLKAVSAINRINSTGFRFRNLFVKTNPDPPSRYHLLRCLRPLLPHITLDLRCGAPARDGIFDLHLTPCW